MGMIMLEMEYMDEICLVLVLLLQEYSNVQLRYKYYLTLEN